MARGGQRRGGRGGCAARGRRAADARRISLAAHGRLTFRARPASRRPCAARPAGRWRPPRPPGRWIRARPLLQRPWSLRRGGAGVASCGAVKSQVRAGRGGGRRRPPAPGRGPRGRESCRGPAAAPRGAGPGNPGSPLPSPGAPGAGPQRGRARAAQHGPSGSRGGRSGGGLAPGEGRSDAVLQGGWGNTRAPGRRPRRPALPRTLLLCLARPARSRARRRRAALARPVNRPWRELTGPPRPPAGRQRAARAPGRGARANWAAAAPRGLSSGPVAEPLAWNAREAGPRGPSRAAPPSRRGQASRTAGRTSLTHLAAAVAARVCRGDACQARAGNRAGSRAGRGVDAALRAA
jgi:hypothetical protein